MRKVFFVTLLMLAGVAGAGLTEYKQVKVMKLQKTVFINVAQIVQDSGVGKQEAVRNEQVKQVLLDAQRAAKEAYRSLPEKEATQKEAADAALINQVWQGEQRHARTQSLRAVAAAAERYRSEHNLELILVSDQVMAAESKNDVSKGVTAALKKVTVDYGKLPEVTIKDAEADKANGPARQESAEGIEGK